MDNKIASYLIASLVQRINRNQIGTISDQEKEALAHALTLLAEGSPPLGISTIPIAVPGSALPVPAGSVSKKSAAPPLPAISLVTKSLKRKEPSDPTVLLCLDFGTASSKAFATTSDGEQLDLELGKAAGAAGYTVPSSVFIADDGKAYFGAEAVERSSNLKEAGRERLDSIKSWLSLREDGDLDHEVLPPAFNPTEYELSEGDLIRIYLAFLTDIACDSLAEWQIDGEPIGRYAVRRYARPCGKNSRQSMWVDNLMKRLLADAQVLADTFHGKWSGGVPVAEIKAAVEAVKRLQQRPDYLVAQGVAEPVAVASGAVALSENRIDAYMVVDAGAGTTDFGLFFVIRNKELAHPKVFQVTPSIKGLNQAGDRVDQLLQAFIRAREPFDPVSTLGKMVEADIRRRIRVWKEILFTTGKLDYVLADSTIGSITREEFLNTPGMLQFKERLEAGFKESLEAVDASYLNYLAMDPVRLQVILTGGSSKLTFMAELASGYIDIHGKKIRRTSADVVPEWLEDAAEEMAIVYPQLAVAIGGASAELPSTDFGPQEFMRQVKPTYVATNMRITGT